MKQICNLAKAIGLTIALVAAIALYENCVTYAAGTGNAEAEITRFPETLDKNCRHGRAKLFDECSDQLTLFNAALKRSIAENKVLLVSFGAEWCIWCHVFDQYIHGGKTRFTYTFGTPDDPNVSETATLYEKEQTDVSADADALRSYVSRSFVVVHIDGLFAPNGHDTLEKTGADRHYDGGLPYIFTVKADGRFAAKFQPNRVETRRDGIWDWYRGYDRHGLMEQLSELRDAALRPGTP